MTGHWSRERFARGQSLLLPGVAEGAPLGGVLDSLLRLIESLVPGMQCSVRLVVGPRAARPPAQELLAAIARCAERR